MGRGYKLDNKNLLKDINNVVYNLNIHAGTKATSSIFAHVKLTDSYNTNQGNANSAVGASSKAVYDLYSRLGDQVKYVLDGDKLTITIRNRNN